MGFELFGKKVFDFTMPFSDFEAWSTIIAVSVSSFIIFLILSNMAKRHKDSKKS